MATNLTPEDIAYLNANGGGFINGVQYQPQYATADYVPGDKPQAWIAYDPNRNGVGTSYDMFNPDGTFARTGTMKSGNDPALLAGFLAAAGAMGFGLPMLQGGAAAGGSSVPGWAEYMAELNGAAPAAGSGGIGSLTALEAGTTPAATSAALTGAAVAPTVGGASVLSTLGKNGGLLAAGLGALAGSQPQQQSQSATKSYPEWLMPYITGQNGLLNLTQAQLQRSQSPEALQGWQNVQNVGQGLLSMPVASNGFTQRYGSR